MTSSLFASPARALYAAIASTFVLSASIVSSQAAGLPGMRGHDHTGITVPDMKQAETFFVDVLGCQKAMSFGPFSDDKGNFMKDAPDVNPPAVFPQIRRGRGDCA